MKILYNILLALASPILLWSLYAKKQGKPSIGYRWKEHFGYTPLLKTQQPPIWIHAVSVGEVIAATPIIKTIKAHNPGQPILVTTTTTTGAEQVEKLGNLVEHRYMPIDFNFAVRRFLKSIRPKNMLIMETELWPNTLNTVANFGVPITVLNARLSEKSYRGYRKVQPIFNLLSKHLSHVCCQYREDAERFINLGIAKDKVYVTGSVKFDIDTSEKTQRLGMELRSEFGQRPVWVAASTHKGEDEIILDAHRSLMRTLPNALLVLVPRHPERFNSVFELCNNLSFNTVKRTSSQSVTEETQVYLGDTMGEMLTLIGASDICFMGGSFLGSKVGGHNLLEPAALAKPSLTGPSYYNFSDITKKLVKLGATEIVHSSDELTQRLEHLLIHPEQAQELGKYAKKFIEENSGSVPKTLKIVFS
ncbi:lipid IV(A) 3-deoxy-D-manno-octulosonic acid transferase [Vibrio splendidus]|uniref:3-deoxy-D-manno-octulosonic acid transferase n=1 Tax=Vibrio splendidus TaxID=29497 RepID=A0A2T5EV60_VIBSP|nr:lipid IV(A) 3-deoxy-D-manno-octulosonic acid transferase [Vibrio splendidus]PTP34275.1 3-deoxy-D-manno-octulosonic acid transferase [Vibrio splendidus]